MHFTYFQAVQVPPPAYGDVVVEEVNDKNETPPPSYEEVVTCNRH